MEAFLLKLFIFLVAASITVPLAKKLGLGSVLGYLLAGIAIGPFGFSMIGQVEEVMHFTEFGVVMMLFLVGLELKPSLLWKLRVPILGMGGMQVFLSVAVISGVLLIFIPWQQSFAIGLTLASSSTAIVLQTLNEKGLMNSPTGRSIFSVLLFQDLAVIPMLAFMPLLATMSIHDGRHAEEALLDIASLPGYLQLIITFLAILLIFLISKFASRPIFRAIAATRVREVFVATALAIVVGISLLMTFVGLSPALGTFLAGVVLADSEYRHELESDIESFKGLLLGIFFISIGASLDFKLIIDEISLIGGIVAGLFILKAIVLYIVGAIFKIGGKEKALFAVCLAGGGEFAFVLFQFTKVNGILPESIIEPFISAVAISMFFSPILFILYEKLSGLDSTEQSNQEADTIDREGHKVILAGFGRLGLDLGRFLISAGVKPVIIDNDASNVDILRKFGFEVYYGDITRLDLLHSAGAEDAELLIITMSDVEMSIKLIELAKKHYPHLKIAVNAEDRSATYQLMNLGITNIRRETYGSALALGQDALKLIGVDPYEAYRMMRLFRKKDEDMIPALYKEAKEDLDSYISLYRQHSADLEELLNMDLETNDTELDKAWTVTNPEM